MENIVFARSPRTDRAVDDYGPSVQEAEALLERTSDECCLSLGIIFVEFRQAGDEEIKDLVNDGWVLMDEKKMADFGEAFSKAFDDLMEGIGR